MHSRSPHLDGQPRIRRGREPHSRGPGPGPRPPHTRSQCRLAAACGRACRRGACPRRAPRRDGVPRGVVRGPRALPRLADRRRVDLVDNQHDLRQRRGPCRGPAPSSGIHREHQRWTHDQAQRAVQRHCPAAPRSWFVPQIPRRPGRHRCHRHGQDRSRSHLSGTYRGLRGVPPRPLRRRWHRGAQRRQGLVRRSRVGVS